MLLWMAGSVARHHNFFKAAPDDIVKIVGEDFRRLARDRAASAATQAAGKPIYLSGRSNSAQLGFNCATTANFAFRLWPAGNRFGSAATFASDDPVF
jgi:hypothetical protein